MEKTTHLIMGLIFGFILYYNGLAPQYAFLSAASSLIPDIDWLIDKEWISRRSIIRKYWKRAFGGRGFHRTILHNIWALLAIDLVIYLYTSYNYLLLIGFSAGFISHLLLDSLTKTGIYWLWPYGDERITGKSRFHIKWRITTGGIGERIFQITLILLLLLIIYEYQPILQELLKKLFSRY